MEQNSNNMSLTDLRVLLVDDDAFIRRVTVSILNSLNISEVLEAKNGLKAMSILKLNKIDLLITDIQMPEVNGIELIKQIRLDNTSCEPNLRTIVITSFSNMEVVGACLALDINGFLVKPITTENAIKKIELAMSEPVTLAHQDSYKQVKSDLGSLEYRGSKDDEITEVYVDSSPSITQSPGKITGTLIYLKDLKPGMQLLEDLCSSRGTKLISSGIVLNENLINRIDELMSVIKTGQIRVKISG